MLGVGDIERVLRSKPKQRPKWIPFVVLVATLALFVGLGVFQWKLIPVIILLIVLAVHEAGHWLGMKHFKYRDIQVFFIPLLGAATSGQSDSRSGYEKAIVTLMGPLPGIILGTIGVILIHHGIVNSKLIGYFLFLMLLINWFNLLPFYPLDGGRLLDHTLFCRLPILGFVFKAFGVLAMGYLAIRSHSAIFGFFAYTWFLSLKTEYTRVKLIRKIRKAGISMDDDPVQIIPRQALSLMLPELNVAFFGTQIKAAGVAQYALSTWRLISEIPPSPLVLAALVTIYLIALMVGTVTLSYIGFDVFAFAK